MSELMIEKRDGEAERFDSLKIAAAIRNAAVAAGNHENVDYEGLAREVEADIRDRFEDSAFSPNVENVHNIVELHLMRSGHIETARAYISYRIAKKQKSDSDRKKMSFLRKLTIKKSDGRTVRFDPKKLRSTIARCADGLPDVDQESIFGETCKNIFDGMPSKDMDKAVVMAATPMLVLDTQYSTFLGRIVRQMISKEVFGRSTEIGSEAADTCYRDSFKDTIARGVKDTVYDERMLTFNLEFLAAALKPERDELLNRQSLETLQQRYLTKLDGRIAEMPQTFWMRVAMGLAIAEEDRNSRAVEFYEVMSKLLYVPSTPTLFQSGTTFPQLSSCYLTSVDDDLRDIFKSFGDNAQLSKWSGGIGTDWSNVRSMHSLIASTRVNSQGVVPFLKIASDTTVAINRSGKRHGAAAVYLETWHLDIEEFLDLRKNTGDDRRRTHDLNTVNWIPDLFMKRVQENGVWSLFSPNEVPELHDLYGKAFETAYLAYEEKGLRGELKNFRQIQSVDLLRKMIDMLAATGHPWLTWKDPCNIRSPQDHVGVIHSSNLCTEITLNTSPSKLSEEKLINGNIFRTWRSGEVAVCNLGSLVIHHFIDDEGTLDLGLLRSTVRTAMRMLDNVIDINFYPIPEARVSNLRHRPVGLGVMGLQDALWTLDMHFEEAHEFVDMLHESISYYAIEASCDMAKERGTYESYRGSKWDRGLFPLDTVDLLEAERGEKIMVNRTQRLNWPSLKEKVAAYGMRNSNTMAIAPTATISTIVGCKPSFEATYKNFYLKKNMSGEFSVVNEELMDELKALGLYNREMADDIIYHDGSIQKITRIPAKIRRKYRTVFEIDQKVLIELTALRQKWIDQSQSHNIFMATKKGKLIWDVYMYAWKCGLKTTYYFRSLGASSTEKTLDAAKYGLTQTREFDTVSSTEEPKQCRIDNPECEACQ